jgi:hypothetical protein
MGMDSSWDWPRRAEGHWPLFSDNGVKNNPLSGLRAPDDRGEVFGLFVGFVRKVRTDARHF